MEYKLVDPLTEREREILRYLADHLSNQEIADKLFLAEKTVRWYNSQIFQKLGVSRRKEAVERAGQLGLLSIQTALSSNSSFKNNLSHQTAPFVGRTRDIEKVIHLLADENARLITILAPGGMGKTRLAVEVAKRQLGQFRDGVYFISLESISEAGQVPLTVAEQIGFVFHGTEPLEEQLLGFLRDRLMLLVLDNFEQVLDSACYVDQILESAPGIRVLATSRERLNLQRETVHILRGLDFPILEGTFSPDKFDAVKLFLQSSQRVRPGIRAEVGSMPDLVRICQLTAGMPLAIEMAAGWVDTLSLKQIADELQKGMDILETGLRDVAERHRSIRATFEQTWLQLAEEDQKVFMCLSVFQNGFGLEAAGDVAGVSRQGMQRLIHKALVEGQDNGRFSIHELLRQFGAEKLAQSGENAAVQSRHTAFFIRFMTERRPDIPAQNQLEVVAQIDADFENVRQAWHHTVQQNSWEKLLTILDTLWFYCEVRTRSQEGLAMLQQAEQELKDFSAGGENDLFFGRLLARLSWFYYDIGLVLKSLDASQEAIQILNRYDYQRDLLSALYSRQIVALTHFNIETASEILREGLSLARLIGDQSWEGKFLVWLAISKVVQNDFDSARILVEDGLAVFERLSDYWGTMRPLSVLGDLEESQGNFTRATECFQRSLAISESFGHSFTIGANKTHLARIAFKEGQHNLARQHLKAAIRAYWDAGYLWATPFPLVFAAIMMAEQGEPMRAVEILGTVDPHIISYRRMDQDALVLRDKLARRLNPEQFSAAWTFGQQRQLKTLVNEMLQNL